MYFQGDKMKNFLKIMITIFILFGSSFNNLRIYGYIQLDATSRIVYNDAELIDAIASDNGVINIYLGADINLSTARINSNKASITICGENPNNLGTRYTITETLATDWTNNIYVYSTNSKTKNIYFKNINIIGKNYYGINPVSDSQSNVTTTFENVNYKGPQLLYNVSGNAIFLGNNDITIDRYISGSSPVEEAVEANTVNISGNLNINKLSGSNAIFYLHGSSTGRSFTVQDNSRVNISSVSIYGVVYSSSSTTDVSIGNNAKVYCTMTYSGGCGFTSSNGYFKSFSLGENSILDVNSPNGNSYSLLAVASNLALEKNSCLSLRSYKATDPILTMNGGRIIMNQPKSVLLYAGPSSTERLIYNRSSNTININNVKTINCWNTPGNGDFTDTPLEHIQTASGNLITTSIPIDGYTTGAFSLPSDVTYGGNLNFKNNKVLSIGSLDTYINTPVTDITTMIIGITAPSSYVRLYYNEGSNTSWQYSNVVQADENGNFAINKSFKPYTKIQIQVNYNYLTDTSPFITVLDTIKPTANPKNQVLTVNSPFTNNPDDLIADVKDNSDGTLSQGIIKKITKYPNMYDVGFTTCEVTLTDNGGNDNIIIVPIFINDGNYSIYENIAFSALDFTESLIALYYFEDDINNFILEHSFAHAIDILTGSDLTKDIIVDSTNLSKNSQVGSYSSILKIGTLTKTINTQIIETGELKFKIIPSIFSFKTTKISSNYSLIKRDHFRFEVSDTRFPGQKWMLTASIEEPLSTSNGHTLPNSLVYIDNDKNIIPLSSSPLKVFEYITSSTSIIPIEWKDDEGILLYLNLTDAYSYVEYSTTINWNLINAP